MYQAVPWDGHLVQLSRCLHPTGKHMDVMPAPLPPYSIYLYYTGQLAATLLGNLGWFAVPISILSSGTAGTSI